MFINRKGIVILTLIIWIVIIGVGIIYVPKIYNWYVEQNEIRLIKSNVESVEKEIRSELISKHPIIIWNSIDGLIKSLNIQNPITRGVQTANGFSTPGDIVVKFNSIDTFTIDAIGPDGELLNLNIVVK